MFMQLILLHLLLLFQLSSESAKDTYDNFCSGESGCYQYQKCVEGRCLCNPAEKRFWTGSECKVCPTNYDVTKDRCYKLFTDLKTWTDARKHCRTQSADLFTWRNNEDEVLLRSIGQKWISTNSTIIAVVFQKNTSNLAWSGGTIKYEPFDVEWVDPDGMSLTENSKKWCDSINHANYELLKQPTLGSRNVGNSVEREECITYNVGRHGAAFFCLEDDYCSQKYAFICEMNAASIKLANSANHGNNNNINSGIGELVPTTSSTSGGDIDNGGSTSEGGTDNGGSPSALGETSSLLSKRNIIIFAVVGIVLIVGAISGYMIIQKKNGSTNDSTDESGDVSQGRPSFASSIGSIME